MSMHDTSDADDPTQDFPTSEGEFHALLADSTMDEIGSRDHQTAVVHALLAIASEIRMLRKQGMG
jgi:hypothetical protein